MSPRAPLAPDPDALVAAVLACPHVAAMSGGVLGEVATYLPGRRVRGIRIRPDEVAVHVIGVYGPAVREIVAQVMTAVAPLTRGNALSVQVDDLAVDLEEPQPPAALGGQPSMRGTPRA